MSKSGWIEKRIVEGEYIYSYHVHSSWCPERVELQAVVAEEDLRLYMKEHNGR